MRDVTLGSYYACEGPLHSLHPLTKLLTFLGFSVMLFFEHTPAALGLSFAFLLALGLAGRLPLRLLLRNYRWMLTAAVISALVYLLQEKTPVQALLPVLRLCALLMASSVLTLTTKPADIAYAAGMLVPSRDFTMMTGIALAFIPSLSEEASRINDAQKSRGAKVNLKTAVSVIVPLFASAFRRAGNLADAMTSRGYGRTKKPSRLHTPQFGTGDLLIITFFFILLGAVVFTEAQPWPL